jgi:hypothetical protein
VEDEGPTVRILPMPPQIIPQSIVSPGLLAHVLTAKFVDHLPLYRQEKIFARLGVEISRATMSNWAMRAAEACVPLLNLIHDEILAARLINIDETTTQVLAEPGRPATATSYMWLFRRGDPDRPALLYQYHPTRAGDVARTFLGDYQGIVQTDGFSGYDFLDHQAGGQQVGADTAVGSAHAQLPQSGIAQRGEGLARKGALAVGGGGVRAHLAGGDLASGVAPALLLFGERQIGHGGILTSSLANWVVDSNGVGAGLGLRGAASQRLRGDTSAMISPVASMAR